MAFAFVQKADTGTAGMGGLSSKALSFSSNTTVGNRLFCAVTYRKGFGGDVTASVTDSASNSWSSLLKTTILNDGTFFDYVELFSAQGASQVLSSGNVTTTFSQSLNDGAMAILEYSGLDTSGTPVDVSVGAGGNSSSPASGSTSATNAANELALSVLGLPNSDVDSSFTASGYTQRVGAFGLFGVGAIWVGEKSSGTSGTTQSASGTLASSINWGLQVVVCKLPTASQDTPELRGRPFGLRGQVQMNQLLAQ